MRFASLGSGSEGNGLLVEASDGTHTSLVLLDCGFPVAEAERRMARLGIRAADLNAIVVTHEHGDHISGVARLAQRHAIAVWGTHGTLRGLGQARLSGLVLHHCQPEEAFAVGAIEVLPFAVPHDAREPIQCVFGDGQHRLGVLTDTGSGTPHVVEMLAGCDALVLECNHDRELLARSSYPAVLKRRIGGGYGHLSNVQSAALLAALDRRRLNIVVAAHLSRKNNTPQLARKALAEVLECAEPDIRVADQDLGLDWISI